MLALRKWLLMMQFLGRGERLVSDSFLASPL